MTIYDIFCPVPFLPSPFGFRRLELTDLIYELRAITDGHPLRSATKSASSTAPASAPKEAGRNRELNRGELILIFTSLLLCFSLRFSFVWNSLIF